MAHTTHHSSRAFSRQLEIPRDQWSLFLTIGITLMAMGIVALIAINITSLVSVVIFGILLLASGALQIAATVSASWDSNRSYMMRIAIGALYGIVGLLMIFSPTAWARHITMLLAFVFIIGGGYRIYSALQVRNQGWMLFSGVITATLGVIIWLDWPSSALWVIGLLIGVDLLTTGALWTRLALAARPPTEPRAT